MDVGGFALITGAASGIGKACARAFIKEGAAGVALVDINPEALQTARAELETEMAGMVRRRTTATTDENKQQQQQPRLATYVLDVTDEEQVQRVVAEAAAWLGRLDYVVNAAGVVCQPGEAANATTGDWKRTLQTNLDGTFFVLRAAVQIMRGQGPLVSSGVVDDEEKKEQEGGKQERQEKARGSIVNVASILGLRGKAWTAAYVASKHAVVGLTRSAAVDHADEGVRINAICPGYTDTPMMDPELRELLAATVAETPMGRWARPDEIADGVLFLAGGRSSFVTGTTLAVDGGYTAR
ncbi:hypothetical protein E4U55_000233 [Claviceps digitariae]|nr:hypothetical protein E4U55_000233 [Claviceps digitariae]